jgi:hypothetical protein
MHDPSSRVPGRLRVSYLTFFGSDDEEITPARLWRLFFLSIRFSIFVEVFPVALLSLAIALPTVVRPNKSASDSASNFILKSPEGIKL